MTNEEARAAILKQVDFEKETLLLFSWTGKVGDEVRPKGGNPGVAVFEYVPGLASPWWGTPSCSPSPPGRRSR